MTSDARAELSIVLSSVLGGLPHHRGHGYGAFCSSLKWLQGCSECISQSRKLSKSEVYAEGRFDVGEILLSVVLPEAACSSEIGSMLGSSLMSSPTGIVCK